MAISPKDLLALTPEDEESVGKIEKLLDEKLTSQFEPGSGGNARINVGFLADSVKCRLTYKMKKELENRYTKAGWTVGFDGDFIVMSEPRPAHPVKVAAPPAPKAAPKAPAVPLDELLDDENLPPPEAFPSDAEIMSEVLGQEAPRVVRDPGGPRPPIVNSTTREDPDNPYQRRKLSSG
jgi:hypothetical protein